MADECRWQLIDIEVRLLINGAGHFILGTPAKKWLRI
jgi:hypothetical protein